jgi:murein L,D-transpeptidase YcbB/YkuD
MRKAVHLHIIPALFAALALLCVDASAQTAVEPERDQIRPLIAGATLSQLRRPDIASYRSALDDFYRNSNYAPQWFGQGARSRAGLSELASAPTHGLDAADYDVAWLETETQAIAAGGGTPERIARADVALTVAFFRLLSDLHFGRIAPAQAGFLFASGKKPLDLASLVRGGMAKGNLHDVVVAVEPSFALYGRLEAALARYRTIAKAQLPPLPELPAGTRKVQPGGDYAGVAALAERLRLVGDLPVDAPPPDGNSYSGAIVEAVRSFQVRHGLKDDAVLGRDTLAQLATPFDQRVRSIELSLERLRWLPTLPGGPVIAVNIPSFRLWAFVDAHDDRAAQLQMPVIVGRAVKARETPVFIGEMRYVEFSPYWNVPPAIQRSEIVPKLERDPGYLEREHLEAVSVRGDATPITAVNATTLDGLKSGALRVRQRPGGDNALGRVKFVLPNTLDIYLHGTSAQQLFAETERDFSHGCIRLSDPPALAQFVLRDRPEWTRERIAEAMALDKTTTVTLTQPIPVIIFYTTAIVDATGRVFFQSDIYGYDRRLEQAMRSR